MAPPEFTTWIFKDREQLRMEGSCVKTKKTKGPDLIRLGWTPNFPSDFFQNVLFVEVQQELFSYYNASAFFFFFLMILT